MERSWVVRISEWVNVPYNYNIVLILQLELFPPRPPSTLCMERCQFNYKALDTWHLIQYNKKNQCVSLEPEIFLCKPTLKLKLEGQINSNFDEISVHCSRRRELCVDWCWCLKFLSICSDVETHLVRSFLIAEFSVYIELLCLASLFGAHWICTKREM